MSGLRVVVYMAVVACFMPVFSVAAQSLSFSITPTIFDMMAEPQQAWSSGVKVINNNDFELTVYATAVNFVPQGERGHGAFLPIAPTEEGTTLASWMTLPEEAIVIPKESSVVVPVQISIPADASPGGHYAAVMIGTKPPVEEGSLEIQTSQIITALFFVRVAGAVVEDGFIRTFRPAHWFATSPTMDFMLRFENKGTVHLQPQGEIRITNMWGKERGIIPINHETNFGNVLPNSIRLFEYSWRGEASVLDIGRYTADLSLAYGGATRNFETRTVSFWVIPLKPVLITLLVLVGIIFFVVRSIRSYVRYTLELSGIDPRYSVSSKRYVLHEGDVRIERPAQIVAPVSSGYKDLRARLVGVTKLFDIVRVVWHFIMGYPRFFMSVLGFIGVFFVLWWYLSSVSVHQKAYEVVVDNGGQSITLSSEEIAYNETHEATSVSTNDAQTFTLTIVNAGAPFGAGGEVADVLTDAEYRVDELFADMDNEKQTSVIIYDPELSAVAADMSERLGGLLISAYPSNGSTTAITVYLGSDFSR